MNITTDSRQYRKDMGQKNISVWVDASLYPIIKEFIDSARLQFKRQKLEKQLNDARMNRSEQ